MSLVASLRRTANRVLSAFDLQLVKKTEFDDLTRSSLPEEPHPALTAEAENYLQDSNPLLQSLRQRYATHPASVHSQWSRDFISNRVGFKDFRSDNAYVWQGRQFSDQTYLLTVYYARTIDRLGLFDRFTEDGMFSPFAFQFNGKLVSRDLIDSVLEINFLHERLGDRKLAMLDIGAGYGRLASRISESRPNIDPIYCTDAIPESTFLCNFYLKYRKARAQAVPLDEVEAVVKRGGIDLATNIHSFSECTRASISWWLSLLREGKVKYLFIVPNRSEKLLSTEPDGSRVDAADIIAQAGYRMVFKRPKYGDASGRDATGMDRFGIGPTWYLWFEREE
jgi:hypothetical protein